MPVASDAYYTILHDTELTGQVYGYDPDGDAITAQLVSGPSHGSLTFHANGSFTYTPNQRFVGSDSFTFTWTDGLVSDTVAHVWIEVYNHAPIAWGEEYVIAANAAWQLEAPGLLANDWDWDGDSLSVLLDQTAGIRLDPAPEPSASWSVELQPHGLVVVAPPPDWEGTMEIPYHVTDGVHTSGPAILRLRVNSGPLPRDDVYIVPEDEDLVIADPAQGVLAN
ncbi:MAG: cadherin-like domain-containing protein, partial [Gemmatales bacterium]|nr:cadherin-like domain-containing protein [Gemmatales bacterium]